MTDSEVLGAIRFKISKIIREHLSSRHATRHILSIRGNIENGKFIPSESGRYAVRVVDLEPEIPAKFTFAGMTVLTPHSTGELIKQIGFARIVGE